LTVGACVSLIVGLIVGTFVGIFVGIGVGFGDGFGDGEAASPSLQMYHVVVAHEEWERTKGGRRQFSNISQERKLMLAPKVANVPNKYQQKEEKADRYHILDGRLRGKRHSTVRPSVPNKKSLSLFQKVKYGTGTVLTAMNCVISENGPFLY
jgi:hypothetical protein